MLGLLNQSNTIALMITETKQYILTIVIFTSGRDYALYCKPCQRQQSQAKRIGIQKGQAINMMG
ncbi:MAG: hypothetical protein EBT92_08970 [Planctomycetes bacterium]|nr:hypothetical protein [Planctomycetota bacterium]NBY02580.1 hypothetical protein [Planctomycetota bacterium]